ncbi:MAG: FAD-dependent oxidoreductase [Clostridia bacterium]|nr:FAD-dependent oxidoreductase [Clostridia bacterium]
MNYLTETFDVVVVGGGLSGICAAIASARHGAKTALIHNRPVLGGNASSEIRMHICGADVHGSRANFRETGIVEELQLKNKYRNHYHSYALFDSVLWEMCSFEPNLSLYLNTHIDCVEVEDGKIVSVEGTQNTTEKTFAFLGDIFIDTTGEGTVGALAGAEFMYGREDKSAFDEPHALDKADNFTMGNSLMFVSEDMGKPVKFEKPFWANTYTEDELNLRHHGDINSGYWWIELGGTDMHIIDDAEKIRDELIKAVYGIWDHIKNSGDHGAENHELTWVGMLPGKRESRRLLGDYVLNETDCVTSRRFEDAVAYGGWYIDAHAMGGLTAKNDEPTTYLYFDDVYTIPYRSLVSKNIDNLLLGGRAISASHLAFASSRVMATCGVVGQAVGTAAAEAIKKGIMPRDMYDHIKELQQMLLKDDCYIPSVKNCDEKDLALTSKVTADNEGAEVLINGVDRTVGDESNSYVAKLGEKIYFDLDKAKDVSEVILKFDSNLSKEVTISIIGHVKAKQQPGAPCELVKDYSLSFYKDGECVHQVKVDNNHLRYNRITLDKAVLCDRVCLEIEATCGCENPRIFEVRIY